jgi:ATP-dependent DNA helicase DinG
LAKALPGYVRREAQVEMASEVAHAIDTRGVVLAEAGTGTGKTFAYLVPALLWGGKVIVSTGTKTLQDQLFERDLPAVRAALNVPVTIALLKGRSNYVCHYHAERAFENGRMTSREDVAHLRRIKTFLKTTRSGDKAELGTVPENALIWSLVTSTRDTCLGSECPAYKDCFVMQARRDAQQADIVVVNHHLFFADVMLRDEGVNELLPAANTVIFDEAHQLPDTATAFFGDVVGSTHINELCRDALAEGHTHARDAARWPDVVAPVEQAVRELRLAVAGAASGSPAIGNPMRGSAAVKMALNQIAPSSDFFPALEKLRTELAVMAGVLESQAARAETLDALSKRAKDLLAKLKAWDAPLPAPVALGPDEEDPGHIAWLDVFASSIQLLRSPLSIAPIFTRERESYPRAWVFTSATLAIKSDFTHFSAQLGLQDAVARTWPSPFDYERQAMLYVPQGMPEPQNSSYTQAVTDAVWPLVKAAGGRTFLLCTTLRAVDRAAEMLAGRCEAHGITLLKQGDAARTELLERFRNTPNAILVGSQSFWEGIDVRGQALSLVVIDKLPFAPPDDPVLAARLARIEAAGRNPFMEYQVPAAVLSLKQGAGRLIRSETDHGVLMICDPRIITKPYGRRIWQSLPPFRRTREADEAVAFLSDVTAEPSMQQKPA